MAIAQWVGRRRFHAPSRAVNCERLPQVLAGLHFLAFACLMLHQLIQMFSSS